MTIKSENPLYTLIKAELSKADRPLTCVDLMLNQDLRTEASKQVKQMKSRRHAGADAEQLSRAATNHVSNALGLMWRKGDVIRFPSTDPATLARFSYELVKKEPVQAKPILPPPAPLMGRTPIKINETSEGVEIETDKFVIVIKHK